MAGDRCTPVVILVDHRNDRGHIKAMQTFWREQASLGSVCDYSFSQVTRQKLAMVVNREPVCKTCNHDPINMLTEELRAFNRGEVTAEDVDKLKQSLRSVSQEIDVALGELLRYGDRHTEGMISANIIPIVATS